MKFRMIITDERGEEWNEDEDRVNITTIEMAQVWAETTIKEFNAYLRPHELPRTLVRVEHLDDESSKHDWLKASLTTIADPRGGTYDEIICLECEITGRRYGLTSIQRDPEFKAYGYGDCKQAKILLERRRKRREKAIANAKKN